LLLRRTIVDIKVGVDTHLETGLGEDGTERVVEADESWVLANHFAVELDRQRVRRVVGEEDPLLGRKGGLEECPESLEGRSATLDEDVGGPDGGLNNVGATEAKLCPVELDSTLPQFPLPDC
jgi:hypothetical protein